MNQAQTTPLGREIFLISPPDISDTLYFDAVENYDNIKMQRKALVWGSLCFILISAEHGFEYLFRTCLKDQDRVAEKKVE